MHRMKKTLIEWEKSFYIKRFDKVCIGNAITNIGMDAQFHR